MNIGWENIPEGFDFFLVGKSGAAGKPYMKVDSVQRYVSASGSYVAFEDVGDFEVIARPDKPWSGEGMPPVGTVCEFAGFNPEETSPTDPLVGDKVTVIAHFKSGFLELAAFTFHAPPEFDYLQVAQGAYGCFRPIRTQEQIAADEKKSHVDIMFKIVTGTPDTIYDGVAALYDAGCRIEVTL